MASYSISNRPLFWFAKVSWHHITFPIAVYFGLPKYHGIISYILAHQNIMVCQISWVAKTPACKLSWLTKYLILPPISARPSIMVLQLSQLAKYLGSSNMIYDNAHAGNMSIQPMLAMYDYGDAHAGYTPIYGNAHAGNMSIQPMLAMY